MSKEKEMPNIDDLDGVFGERVDSEDKKCQGERALDMSLLKKTIKYREGSIFAIKAIVALIDEIEESGVGYVSVEELKETLFNAFGE